MAMNYAEILPREVWQQVLLNISIGDLCNVVKTTRHLNDMASWPELWKGMEINMRKVRKCGLAKLYSIKRYKKIKKLDFTDLVLTSEELERILNEIPGSPLKNVNFRGVNLSGVPDGSLARAISCLHTLNLEYTKLTTDQCVKVLEACISSTSLVNLNLSHVNLSQVDPELLARAISHLQTVNLDLCSELTTDQWAKVLEESLSSTTLANVKSSGVRLTEVNAELLASAFSRLQNVNLGWTMLTPNQCVKVLEASLSSTTLLSLDYSCIASKTLVNLNLKDARGKVSADLMASFQQHISKH